MSDEHWDNPKCNLGLLKAELASDRPRELAWVLAIRDYVNLAQFERERAQGRMVPRALQYYAPAVRVFRERFADPGHRYHALAYPFYQAALAQSQTGIEAKWAFAAVAPGPLKGSPRAEVLRAWDAQELEVFVGHRLQGWVKKLSPVSVDCAPAVTRNGDGGWGEPAHLVPGDPAPDVLTEGVPV